MDEILRLSELIKQSRCTVIFTGAGISTQSGIPDFRSKGGIWDRFRPVTYQEFLSSHSKRAEYWKQKFELFEQFRDAKPNAGHEAIVDIERMGHLKGIITQNIDGLHQMAGSDPGRVLEIHGTNRETICLACGATGPWMDTYERLKRGDKTPRCLDCGGWLKPNTISFGQALVPEVLERAESWSKECDFFLAIGSTLVVEPAASLPLAAAENGSTLAILNLTPTPLDTVAELVIHAEAGETLVQAVRAADAP